jgi:streptomycin 6-kinase
MQRPSPATQGDLRMLEQRFRAYVHSESQETRRHFDVVAENLHKDLVDSTKDLVELYRDKHGNHERRIEHLEAVSGVIQA